MRCENCGNELNENDITCSNCGTNIEKNIKDNKKANLLCSISLLLLIFQLFVRIINVNSIILELYYVFNPLIILTLMIYVRINYPKNKFGKVLMWLYIILIICVIVIVIAVIGMCISLCDDMSRIG